MPGDSPPFDNGGSATVGIEGPYGTGEQYSFNQENLHPGLAILFKFPAFSGTNMRVSKNGPSSIARGDIDRGTLMTYTLFYNNFGVQPAENVQLVDTIPPNIEYVFASDGGIYDPARKNLCTTACLARTTEVARQGTW